MHYQQQTPGKLPTDWTDADDIAMAAKDAMSKRPSDLAGIATYDKALST